MTATHPGIIWSAQLGQQARPAVTEGSGTAADSGGGAGQAGTPFADTGSPMINSGSAMSSPSADVAAATRQIQEYLELGHRPASDDVARYRRIDQRAVRSAMRGMAENQNRLICARLPMRPTRLSATPDSAMCAGINSSFITFRSWLALASVRLTRR